MESQLSFIVVLCFLSHASSLIAERTVISLDGNWQIEQGGMDAMPANFNHTVPVPGLADMSSPAFERVGFKSDLREAFWYRRSFEVKKPIPEKALLKIRKAKYGMRVFLNGKQIGESLSCFTPVLLDAKKHLHVGENQLTIRLGAFREAIPKDMPSGWDFEKYRYIPGIYDSVELILSGSPHIANVQIAPNLEQEQARVAVELEPSAKDVSLAYTLREWKTGKVVRTGEANTIDFIVPMTGNRLWTPEDPFLYELELKTSGDKLKTRFGMRSFRFDPETGRAVLNGQPRYMRGSNVCILRFFEDDARKDFPWRKKWVCNLHKKFKGMNWDSLRYCIGFPPDFWYDIADEEGFLIQDEFPVWLLGKAPEDPVAPKMVPQYTDWMRERWNHPCVVIWDAQNESITKETGKVIQQVRGLDISGRPWDNGWEEPDDPGDSIECHPYLFISGHFGNKPFDFGKIAQVSGKPKVKKSQQQGRNAIIVNEYAWLWLNRDGTPTSLTKKIYNHEVGPDSTTKQRRELNIHHLAALTEFWRARRECAAVMHFCGLGYSRPSDKPRPEGGATSDHFIDLENLVLEPLFEKHIRDAFAPVGVMIDEWRQEFSGGTKCDIPVILINDLPDPVEVRIDFSVSGADNQTVKTTIGALGLATNTFSVAMPEKPGVYEMTAEIHRAGSEPIRSRRRIRVTSTHNALNLERDHESVSRP